MLGHFFFLYETQILGKLQRNPVKQPECLSGQVNVLMWQLAHLK